MTIAHRLPTDPDTGIPDLIRNLADDSKRLMGDEVRLAKLEMAENVKRAGKGGLWLGLAFAAGFVALVAFTVLLASLIGRLAGGHYWIGAVATGMLELALAALLFRRGLSAVISTSYTLAESRAEAGKTVRWAKAEIRAS